MTHHGRFLEQYILQPEWDRFAQVGQPIYMGGAMYYEVSFIALLSSRLSSRVSNYNVVVSLPSYRQVLVFIVSTPA